MTDTETATRPAPTLALQGASLPIARYRFTARVHDDLPLPPYAGSLFRGQFGAALRRLACMTRESSCTGCPLRSTCPYPRIFDAAPPEQEHNLQAFSAIPNAYVIEPPATHRPPSAADERPARPGYAAGQLLQFHMVLAGHTLEQLPLILIAWQRALAQGLTQHRSRVELLQVDWLDAQHQPTTVWQADTPHLAPHQPQLTVPHTTPSGALHLHITTPLRLQHQGKPLHAAQLTPRTLLAALARRIALVLEFHAGQAQWGHLVPTIVQAAHNLQDERDLRWFDWVRYSSRQHQEMRLGGVVGRWTLHPQDADTAAQLWPWLWLGQWLHVGKNASFGLGGYRLSAATT